MSIQQIIAEYLEQATLLQVATSVDNTPWLCTVCFGYDAHFDLYWFSRHDTRHSREIALNHTAAGAVVLPHTLGDASRGLQISGVATELRAADEIAAGLLAMKGRYGMPEASVNQKKHELLSQTADYGLYRLRPSLIVLFDKLNFADSPRQTWTPATAPGHQ